MEVVMPQLGETVEEDVLIVHRRINLGIAVDLPGEGLLVPVIHDAAGMSVPALAHATRRLAAKARNKQLTPDDTTGGTYTITNNGVNGTLITAPVIHQPQVAVLSSDGVRRRLVVVEHDAGDAVAVRPVGVLAQSFDHRVIDGAYSGAFLNRARSILEETDWHAEVG